MPQYLVLLSIPGLRDKDLAEMPRLSRLVSSGAKAHLTPSFPAVTCPVQANLTTGATPDMHGVIANGFYWREKQEVEMWTAWNEVIARPQIWDILADHDTELTSAVWFPMLSKGCGAEYICTPAPIHNPDGSESLWCYTRPEELYGQLRDTLGHFPLHHFWGPIANIKSSAWIIDSAVLAARQYGPNFFYIYLPHLDYAAQKTGPDSEQAMAAVRELDEALGRLIAEMDAIYDGQPLTWLVASEYEITPVDHVSYPNRVLRDAGLLRVTEQEDGEYLDFANSDAFAMVDHQLSHVFVRNADEQEIRKTADVLRQQEGIAEVLIGADRGQYHLDHPRSGEIVTLSTSNSWQAYYWWLDDARAPGFARTVDIHRKPGYDPVEMHLDPATKGTPLDATLVSGSHGAPVLLGEGGGVLLCSDSELLTTESLRDIDVADVVLRKFGV